MKLECIVEVVQCSALQHIVVNCSGGLLKLLNPWAKLAAAGYGNTGGAKRDQRGNLRKPN